MKALKLHLKNVGPFLDESIDFMPLGDMFLVSGQTGAGKTTIFDAMTYALYGDLAGMRKKALNEFRSDYALPADESFVEFTFSLNHDTYRIYRTLPSVRINRNGKETPVPVELTLECCKSGSTAFCRAEGKPGELQVKINSIIGLSLTEFTQIVLLPQGAFAEFLHENSRDRRDTLAKLFPVDTYARIMASAKEKSDAYSDKRKIVETQLADMLSRFDAEHAAEKMSELDGTIAELSGKRAKLSHALEILGGKIERATSDYADAVKAESLAARLRELDARSEEMKTAEKRAADAALAMKIEGFIRAADNAAALVQGLEEKKKQTLLEKKETELAAEKLDAQVEEISRLKAETAADAVLLKELENHRLLLERIDKARIQADAASTAVHDASRNLTDAQDAEAELEKQLAAFLPESTKPDENDVLAAVLEKRQTAQTACAAAEKAVETAEAVRKLQNEKDVAGQKLEDAKQQTDDTRKLRDNTKCCLDDFMQQQKIQEQNNYACALVQVLKDGAPCPVCGSKEHPHPVQILPETLGLSEKIQTQQKNLTFLDEKLVQQQGTVSSLETLEEQLAKELLEKTAASGVTAEDASCLLAKASDEFASLDTAYNTVQSIVHTLKNKRLYAAELSETLQAAKQTAAAADAEKNALEKDSISGETAELLSCKIQNMTDASAAKQKRIEEYETVRSESDKRLAGIQERMKTLETSCESAVHDREAADAELQQQLAASDFKDTDEARASCMPAEVLKKLQDEISAWKDETARIRVQIESVHTAESSSVLQENLVQLEKEIQAERTDASRTDAQMDELTARRTLLKNTMDRYAELEKQRLELAAESAPYIKLADDLQGKNPKHIPFDAWILGMYFSQIVDYANPRFERISGGRYRFRIAADAGGGHSFRGLDLSVSDSYTGKDRDTATLSGGETFMASISLALALTDVVLNQSGGIRLDSLFIDEGFGTLDGDALDKAVSILQDIRESRTVGIISHVDGLRSVIPACLEVVKGVNGSHIRIQGSDY